MGKSYWTEIKADHDDVDGQEIGKDDIVKCICIDAWKTDDPNEPGEVIAKVTLTKSRDSGVVYIDHIARWDKYAQNIIQEVLQSIKE